MNLLTPSKTSQKSRFLEAFDSYQKESKEPAWLAQTKQKAISRFKELGFPTMRDEDWRYTNVAALEGIPFEVLKTETPVTKKEIAPFLFNSSWPTLVFINGIFRKDLSAGLPNHKGLYAGSLKEVLRSNPELIENALNQISIERNPFIALNTAFLAEGALIYVPEGLILNQPLHFLFVSSKARNSVLQPRNLIVAGKKSKLTAIESFVSFDSSTYWTNSVTQVLAEEGSEIEHYKIQRESDQAFHLNTTQVKLKEKSKYDSVSISFGGRLSRQNFEVSLEEEHAVCFLSGLYLGAGNQHLDYRTFIDHLKPHGTSNQIFKGILSGEASGVFSGKIFVREGAQKTDAHQSNKNLLLSEKATAQTRPQLEILNDDVKCTHGAAVGQLDENAIFYLNTRGIGTNAARKLLCYGFAKEVIDRINVTELAQAMDELALKRFSVDESA